MSKQKRVRYTREEDKEILDYYIKHLQNGYLDNHAASDLFWSGFIRGKQWTRTASSVVTHFRHLLQTSLHLADFLSAEEMFHLMKLHAYKLERAEYKKLEQKYDCKITFDDKMTFQSAERNGRRILPLSADGVSIDAPYVEDKANGR